MALKSPHRDWRLGMINPIDVRAVGLDQLLTNLWLCVVHGTRPLVRLSTPFDSVAQVAELMEKRTAEHFDGFDEAPGAAETWLRSDLLRVLKRHPEQFAVARPVHGLATRLRGSTRASSDSFASWLVYDWICAEDPDLLEELRAFVQVDVAAEDLDLASFALALLGDGEEQDVARPNSENSIRPPLCRGHAATYCDDLRRLLAHRPVMPRTALVDHIQRLTGFHLGLYLLRIFRIVSEVEHRGGAGRCDACRAERGSHLPLPNSPRASRRLRRGRPLPDREARGGVLGATGGRSRPLHPQSPRPQETARVRHRPRGTPSGGRDRLRNDRGDRRRGTCRPPRTTRLLLRQPHRRSAPLQCRERGPHSRAGEGVPAARPLVLSHLRRAARLLLRTPLVQLPPLPSRLASRQEQRGRRAASAARRPPQAPARPRCLTSRDADADRSR